MEMAVKVLPRDKATNIRAGAALLVVGLLVVLASFSGNQAYNITFFYVAVLGTVVGLYGTVLLANSRVVAQRTTARAARKEGAAREWVRLQCPSCSHVFEEEGERPFTAICPNCKASGLIA